MIEDTYNKLKNDRYFYWLGLDYWGVEHAAWLFLGIDPDYVEDNGAEIHTLRLLENGQLIYSLTRDGERAFDDDIEKGVIDKIDKYVFVFRKYIQLLRDNKWGFTEQDLLDYRASPVYWINKAKEKKIEITWLDYAINEGYYNPNKVEDLVEKVLTNKERNTLLIIIAALAKEAKVDVSKISKSGELIANMTQIMGAPIGATTVETHLKKIPEALQSRTK